MSRIVLVATPIQWGCINLQRGVKAERKVDTMTSNMDYLKIIAYIFYSSLVFKTGLYDSNLIRFVRSLPVKYKLQ